MDENIFIELERRIKTTATNRFNASSRLNKHNKFSLWTVMLFSLGLILVSILNLTEDICSKNVDIILIFFSVAILTISTALSMSNFGARAEKFLDCGRELHALALNFKTILNNENEQTNENYEQYQKEYEHILSRYENHELLDHLYTKLMWSDTYNQKWHHYINTYFRFFLEYIIYFILVGVEVLWIYFICHTFTAIS